MLAGCPNPCACEVTWIRYAETWPGMKADVWLVVLVLFYFPPS